MPSPSGADAASEPAVPIGRAVLLAGAAIVLVSAFLTWFWGGEPGSIRYETALQGEESLFAVLSAIAGGIAGLVAAVKRSRSKALAFVGLVGAIACVVLAGIFIDYNGRPVVVFGKTIPTGIGLGAYVGLAGGVLMSLGGIIDGIRSLKR